MNKNQKGKENKNESGNQSEGQLNQQCGKQENNWDHCHTENLPSSPQLLL